MNRPRTLTFKLFLIVFLLGSLRVFAQSKEQKEADLKYFEKKYQEAFYLYQVIYDKYRKKDRDVKMKGMILKMADCNFQTSNHRKAFEYYSRYFSDTLYHAVPQYLDYANAAWFSGKMNHALLLFSRINRNEGDNTTRVREENIRLYLDSVSGGREYNLDSTYTCVELDAGESVDSLAAPMSYLWEFDDGTHSEGIQVRHCFKTAGRRKVTLNIRDKATGFIRYADTSLSFYIEEPPLKFKMQTKYPKQYLPEVYEALDPAKPGEESFEYIWDFGDGEAVLGKKTKHAFNKLGDFKVKLTVLVLDKEKGTKKKYVAYRIVAVTINYQKPEESK